MVEQARKRLITEDRFLEAVQLRNSDFREKILDLVGSATSIRDVISEIVEVATVELVESLSDTTQALQQKVELLEFQEAVTNLQNEIDSMDLSGGINLEPFRQELFAVISEKADQSVVDGILELVNSGYVQVDGVRATLSLVTQPSGRKKMYILEEAP